MIFRIYTKKGRRTIPGKEKKSVKKKQKQEQDPSRTNKVKNLMWCHVSCGEIYAVLSRVQSCSIEMWKKSISNSSVDKEELSRIALRLELRNHDSEDVIPHPNTN